LRVVSRRSIESGDRSKLLATEPSFSKDFRL
jgi:hypothetical protein